MTEKGGGFRRDIGLTGSAFLSFNGIVGAGIFALPATLHLQFGLFSPWLFPLFGLLVLLVALPFARLAALLPQSGGPVAYTAVFGPLASFQAGWLYYVARSTALAANANVFAIYAASLWTPLGTAAGRAATILLLVGTLTVINVVGVRRAIRALDALTLLKALPLIGLAIWGLIHAGGALPAPGPPPPLSAIEGAALIILYAFIGFENSVVPAEETADPRRTIPRALIATVAATAALYFLIQLAYVAVMPAGAAPAAPLAAFAEALIGPAGAILLTATALASVAGNISGAITSTSRVTFALTAQGSLPRWFGVVGARWSTPANSILFMGLVVAALALTGSFVWLAVVSTLARLFVYSACIAALPKVEKQAGALIWAMLAAGLAVCLWAASQSKWESWLGLAGAVAAGTLLYVVARRQAASSSAATVSSIQPPPSTRSPS
ncbi:MAG TPA: APC family permease [Allosphingosinicella sp.]|nr:APC family permease [Allosphingosinicella sp.]